MWMGAIRLDVATKDADYAGTDNLVTTNIVRDGTGLLKLRLDYPTENDLERGRNAPTTTPTCRGSTIRLRLSRTVSVRSRCHILLMGSSSPTG